MELKWRTCKLSVLSIYEMHCDCMCVFLTFTLMAAGSPPLLIQGCSSTSSRRCSEVKWGWLFCICLSLSLSSRRTFWMSLFVRKNAKQFTHIFNLTFFLQNMTLLRISPPIIIPNLSHWLTWMAFDMSSWPCHQHWPSAARGALGEHI